jgi:hypothetical protein
MGNYAGQGATPATVTKPASPGSASVSSAAAAGLAIQACDNACPDYDAAEEASMFNSPAPVSIHEEAAEAPGSAASSPASLGSLVASATPSSPAISFTFRVASRGTPRGDGEEAQSAQALVRAFAGALPGEPGFVGFWSSSLTNIRPLNVLLSKSGACNKHPFKDSSHMTFASFAFALPVQRTAPPSWHPQPRLRTAPCW